MSWAEEDWTVGLSGLVLQKVKELQVHHDRLSRENKQKQLQLDNINTCLEKQTVKNEEVRGELHSVQRDLQRVQDEAKAAVTSRDRLTQELQTKQAQVCSFEGQLDAARNLNNKLTQEVKRLEAELEKIQNSSRSADTTLFSTPSWNTASPWEHNGNRPDERQGYRDEGQSRTLNSRQRLQFSDAATASLPRQQHKTTPHRHLSDQSESFSTPMSVFPWERDDSRSASRRRSPASPQTPQTDVSGHVQLEQGVCGKKADCRAETDVALSAVQSRVSALEEDLNMKATLLKTVQNELAQSKKELAARELSVQKAHNELSVAHTRISKESERASGAEQRLKQLQEELKCQRQNAESSRLQHQQRTKELEKQHQRDITELQKERQCLEKQHQQEVNKLNQELQQARTLHNALQAQADKLSLQKQALDKELDTLKEKVKWTEGQLQESQKKEAQTQGKLTEAVREADGLTVSLEQSRKKERALEEEGRRLAEERADALRLLKELQEQKAAPVTVVQPVQSFSCQSSSYSLRSSPSTPIKRPSAANPPEQRKDEDVCKKRAEVAASYPSDREPGEGIDSEDITVVMSPNSEFLQRREHTTEENRNTSEGTASDSSGASKPFTFDQALSHAPLPAAGPSTNNSVEEDRNLIVSDEKAPTVKSEQTKASEDLKRENATLRSELHDVREELARRLEDLESQRRAEAEARTRLKQLSRKHASQSAEKEEQAKDWRAKLESEKAEADRLKKTVSALEAEVKRERMTREQSEKEEEEEENKALQEQESEMIEFNIQLKKELAEVKAQLALEREERTQMTNTEVDVKQRLSEELEKLRAELEELKRSRKEGALEDERISVANSPLTYLTLHDDELNSNMLCCDNKRLPSPEQHILLCQSTNQWNTLVSQAAADLIQEEPTVLDPECLSPPVTSDLEVTRQNYLVGSSISDQPKELSDVMKESVSSDLEEEVKRLQKEKMKETERADQYLVKLEALQKQVTRQTQQLTMAFEKQSQHISGLLAELQEKESALLSQGEELHHCKQALDALKAQKDSEEQKVQGVFEEVEEGEQEEEAPDEKSVETSELQPNQEKELPSSSLPADTECDAQRDAGLPEAAERPTPVHHSEAHSAAAATLDSVDLDKTHCATEGTESDQDVGPTEELAELLHLRNENQLLKQSLVSLTVSDSSSQVSHPDSEKQEDPSTPNPNTENSEEQRAALQDTKRRGEEEEEDSGKADRGTDEEEEKEAENQLVIDHLQQQVVELCTQLRSLSELTQQQAEELLMWRLASKPAPTFDLPSTSNQSSDGTVQTLAQAPEGSSPHGAQESSGTITVIREDELLLSGSSSKLQGRVLLSRLQHSSFPESTSLQPSKNTVTLQDYSKDWTDIEDSKPEDVEPDLTSPSDICQREDKEKRAAEAGAEAGHMSAERTAPPHRTKDSQSVCEPKQTQAADCHLGNPKITLGTSRETGKINPASDSSGRDVRTEIRSVSSQTEETSSSGRAPAAELRCASTQTEETAEDNDEEELVESPPVSPIPSDEAAKSGDKMLFSGSFPIPADPARLAERIRRNRTQLSAAFDDTEYEPYGLPEVVMKGFADIPTGPSCPYIVRRGLLGTAVVPVPVPQKNQGQENETD
ncbi:uncharacterized protein V6R79_016453 [Siganus canaliculatus]